MNIVFTATSYPRTTADWQSVFIKKLLDAFAMHSEHRTHVWAPQGPLHEGLDYLCTPEDIRFLTSLAEKGGIAHLLRTNKPAAAITGAQLLWRMRKTLLRTQATADIYHLNWLQSLIPLWNIRKPAVATILGSDYQLLRLPGMHTALRHILKRSPVILAPNNEWMVEPLTRHFGDLAEVHYVPFGIDDRWYAIEHRPVQKKHCWICVLRLTRQKMGHLFEWGERIFKDSTTQEFHLFGPNQENISLPSWIHYHGATTADALAQQWFPQARGLISLSEHAEGRPQVMLEALAAGLPIIASRIQAHTDLLANTQAGLLVATSAEFEQAIERYSDDTHHREAAESGRALAKAAYGTWDDCYTRFMLLYKRLLE